MTQGSDTLWKIALGVVSRRGLGIRMSFMTWTRLTVHWIVSDCDLGEVSVYTPSKGCVGLRVYGLHTGVRGHIANMCPGSLE